MIKKLIQRLFAWANPIQPIIWVKLPIHATQEYYRIQSEKLRKHVNEYGYMLIVTVNDTNTTDMVVFNANIETLGIDQIREQVKSMSEF